MTVTDEEKERLASGIPLVVASLKDDALAIGTGASPVFSQMTPSEAYREGIARGLAVALERIGFIYVE